MVTDGSCIITVTIDTIVKECGQINVCIYVCVYMCMYVHVYMFVCTCVYICMYMCICIYMYIYVCAIWREMLEGANFDEMARKVSLPDYTLVD